MLILLPLRAQDIHVLHFSPEESQALREIHRQKEYWNARWAEAEQYIRRRYISEPGTAEAGNVKLPVESVPSMWQFGIAYSDDFEVAVPKPKPCEATE
ncbi:MAG TPA: hypothetical protein VMR62_18620 [Bryobacteraceae bacterium]|nr:hypothetical protein [Bryobacteraceae bacterium]